MASSAEEYSARGSRRTVKGWLTQWGLYLTALLVMTALMPRDAMADCILSNPNSQGQHIDEVCWLQFGAVNTPYAPGYEENRSFDLPDGSRIEMVVRVSGTGTYAGPGGPRIESRQAPTWTGSNFSGNSGFYQLLTPNSAALYVQDGEADRLVLTLEDIRLFSPAGLAVDHVPFEIIIADAERLNSSPAERMDFGVVSGGSAWNTLEWLGAGGPNFGVSVTSIAGDTGAAPPLSACDPVTFIDCLRLRGTGGGDASAMVLSSTRDVSSPGTPFTVMGQIHSTAGQGYAVGVRWGGVRLNKALPNGRAHPDDQFIYEIENVVDNVVQTATTTNATAPGSPSAYISGQTIMPGNALTLRELMAPGSSSTLEQYDRSISCSNPGNPASTTVLPSGNYDPAAPPSVDILELGDSVDCTLTNIPRLVALALNKSASEANIQAGQALTYTLDIVNTGTHDATGAVFTDNLPAGMQISAGDVTCEVISGGAVCGPLGVNVTGAVETGLVVSGAIASLPGTNATPGGSAVRISLQVVAGGDGIQTNTARVDLGGSDTTVTEQDTSDNEDTFDVVVDPGADLELQKVVDVDDPVVGSTVVFTLTLTNNGPADAEAVLVTDQLPSGYTYVSSTPSLGSYDDASGLWTVGDLANGDGATLAISATVNVTGEYLNTALASSTTHDPDTSNNEDDATTTPLGDIEAIDDAYGSVNGYEGNLDVGQVGDNDTLNGAPIDLADMQLTLVGTLPPELTFDPVTGVVGVLPGTPAGPYSFDYELCELANPSNCDTATVTVTVIPPDIIATDDDYGPVNGFDGDSNVGVVGSNDTLNGTPIDLTEVELTLIGTLPPELTFDPVTGIVGVLPGTPAGPYSFDYELCELANPSNCDSATVTVTVGVPDIVATDDDFGPVNGSDGDDNVGVVGTNDTLNGSPIDLADVELTLIGTLPPELTFDPVTGVVGVLPGTPAGPYSFDYELCEVANPSNCDTATVTVNVEAPEIVATDDTYGPVNGYDGGDNIGVVGDNDTLNGDPVTLAEIELSLIGNLPPELTFDPSTGIVGVPPGTPAGPYSFEYQLCERANPSNCDTATVTVNVEAPEIVGTDDNFGPVDGFDGDSNVGVVGTNDTLNGDPITLDEIELSLIGTLPPELTFDPVTGVVGVLPGTPAGPYSFEYQLCERVNPLNCDTATVTLEVTAAVIDAVDDDYREEFVSGASGGVAGNVLGNDTLNAQPATLTNVSLTFIDASHAGLTLEESSGDILVAPGTPAGQYELNYRICDLLNPGNCADALVLVLINEDQLLSLQKQATPQQVRVGDLVRYTLTATNMSAVALTDVILIDTPPPGFSLVEDSLQVSDRDGNFSLNGISPIRVEGLSVDAGARISISYFLRVGAGAAARGDYVNTAQLVLNGMPVSNQARATVRRSADPLFEDTRIWGSVFDDRDGDGWQDSASAGDMKVQGGFAAQAYMPNSTTVDRGEGPQPEADASSPLLHGLNLGELRGRRSSLEPLDSQRIVISQLLSEPRFTDDFVLTTAEGLTLRMNAAGQIEASKRGDMAKGLSAQDILVERKVYPAANGQVRVDYVISNRGIDERGIPGVRIGTVEGMLITTDAHGRFHLEGIDVSHIGRGRNFIMKIDETTLPAGSRSTTGNPLVKRITQGMPTRFDFGVQLPERTATPGSGIEVELGEVFFSPGSATIRAEQMDNLQTLLTAINTHRGGHVEIVGHADEEALGVQRAEALRAALLAGLTGDYGDALSITTGRQIHLIGDGVRLGEVLFVTDKSEVRPAFQPVVQSVAAVISQRLAAGQPTVGITISGHADRRGSLAYNEALGMRRARAVFDAIAQHLSDEERRRVLVESEDTSTGQGRVN